MVLGFLCTSIEDYFKRARSLFSVVPVPAVLNEILEATSAGEPMRAEPVNVVFFNSLQVAQSERYVFAEDNNFDLQAARRPCAMLNGIVPSLPCRSELDS